MLWRPLFPALLLYHFLLSSQVLGSLLPALAWDPNETWRGEMLVSELNCVACHTADEVVRQRLQSRSAPDLSEIGSRVTPQFLRSFLAEPHAAKPGTAMPALLHGKSSEDKTAVAEALTHFLMQMGGEKEPTAGIGANAYKMQEGRALYHQVGCVACHAPQESLETSQPVAARQWQDTSVPLGPLAMKYTVEDLTEFLLDPLKSRPSGRMPRTNLSRSEATSLAMYLVRAQTNAPTTPEAKRIQGLSYEYYEGGMDRTAKLDELTPVATGMVETFSIENRRRDQNFGFRYTGYIRIPMEGDYTFFLASDDGSRLWIGDREVVENDGTHATTERRGRVHLTSGDHPISAVYFNAGGPFEFLVSWAGPGQRKEPIPASVLSYQGQPMAPLNPIVWKLDANKAEEGRRHFASLGCASCHALPNENLNAVSKAPSLLALANTKAAGCLSDQLPDHVPQFDLTAEQRAWIRAALDRASQWRRPLPPAERIHKTMAALQCYACHERGGIGGPDAARAEYFVTTQEEDLGDEGRIPPHLSGVGNKLKADWLRTVLLGQGRVRPYMATRMPQFGEANVASLIQDFAEADRRPGGVKEPIPAQDLKYGRALVGTGGLSCISCHTFGEYPSLGIPAMDLTQMTKRLQPDWFHRYLIDPQSLRPGTRMPSFWPDGQSMRNDLLEGDTHRQINAIWAYLARAKDAGVPPGLIQGEVELVATEEARIYRAFLNDSGVRGIGVAFPEKANYTFNAGELRPALMWHGPFVDAAKHRRGRGAGFEGPLGYNVVAMPPGPTLAFLPEKNASWPGATSRDAGYRMKGYSLDEARRPTFRYAFNGLAVEDKTVALQGELEAYLQRTIRVRTDKPEHPRDGLYHRVWAADSIQAESDSTFLADGKVRIEILEAPGATPWLRTNDGKTELLAPMVFDNSEARISYNLIW